MRLESLLRAARAGQPRAWAQLAKSLSEELHAYFRRRVSDEDAKDLAQSAVLVALEKLSTLESEVSLEGWIVGVARNLQREEKRSQDRRNRLRDGLAAVADVTRTRPSSAARRAQLIRILKEEIEKLSDKMREVLEHELADEDPRTIADRDGIAQSTVRSRRSGAKKVLRKRLLRRTKTPQRGVSKLTAVSTPPPT